LKRIIVIFTLLCCAALSSGVLAANSSPSSLGLNKLKQSESSQTDSAAKSQDNLTVLKQDTVTDFSKMNASIAISPYYGMAQVVKFSPPTYGWKLEDVLVMATDGWNNSSNQPPGLLPFVIEIRDADLKLLYHYEDIQLPYFTSNNGIRMAVIEVPSMLVDKDFYVCFYGYRSLGLVTELQNATGNSYYFDKQTGLLIPGVMPLKNNQTLPVNWLIRVAGR
jgi:hypothetical protein